MTHKYNLMPSISAATKPFSLRLDPELKKWLTDEAKRQDRSVAYITKQAILEQKQRQELEQKYLEQAFQEVVDGEFVSEKAVMSWMESWDAPEELPEPEVDTFLSPE